MKYLQTQQTPKEFAQVPEAVPPYPEHSRLVKHVPFKLLLPVHCEFANLMTLKSGKTAHEIKKEKKKYKN